MLQDHYRRYQLQSHRRLQLVLHRRYQRQLPNRRRSLPAYRLNLPLQNHQRSRLVCPLDPKHLPQQKTRHPRRPDSQRLRSDSHWFLLPQHHRRPRLQLPLHPWTHLHKL